MPFLAFLLVVGITACSHILRGESVTVYTNIGISNIAFWCIVGLACLHFGSGSDFWGDLFLAVAYSVVGTIELIGLLVALYGVVSPLNKEEEQEEKWVKMEPRG